MHSWTMIDLKKNLRMQVFLRPEERRAWVHDVTSCKSLPAHKAYRRVPACLNATERMVASVAASLPLAPSVVMTTDFFPLLIT